MVKNWNPFNVLRGVFVIVASVYLGFHTEFNFAFFAEALSLYDIFIGLKDYLAYLKNRGNSWLLAQLIFPILLSSGLYYLALTRDTVSISYYIGMWDIVLVISRIVIGWQLYGLEHSQAFQSCIKGLTLLLFAILVLYPEHMTYLILGHLVALYFLADVIDEFLEYWVIIRKIDFKWIPFNFYTATSR